MLRGRRNGSGAALRRSGGLWKRRWWREHRGARGAGARRERETCVWLASALPGGKARKAEARGQVAAGSRERE
jgi:hypothetical protein